MKTIPLTQGKLALVDDADHEYLSQFNWWATYAHGNWYAQAKIKLNGAWRNVYMHRLILSVPRVDHKDGNGLNNQKANLRKCSHQENQWNKKKTRGLSKFKGVCWNKNASKWAAYLYRDGKRKHLGYFDSETDAAAAYNNRATIEFGEFALLNSFSSNHVS